MTETVTKKLQSKKHASETLLTRRQVLAGAGAAALFFEPSGVEVQATPSRVVVFSHTTVVTGDTDRAALSDVALAVNGSTIMAIGPTDPILEMYQQAEIYDGRGKALLPGLINCHAHLSATFSRGFNEDFGFPNRAQLVIRPRSLLSEEEATLMATIAALESIRCGTTTVVQNTSRIAPSAAALTKTVLRWLFAESVRDRENGSGTMSP